MAESMPLECHARTTSGHWRASSDTKGDPEELPAHAVFFEAAKTGNILSMPNLKQGQDVNYQDEGEEAPWVWSLAGCVKAQSLPRRR